MDITTWDQNILIRVQRWRRPGLTQFLMILTHTGTGRVWLAVAAGLNVLNYLGVNFVPNQVQFLRAMLCPLLAWILGAGIKKVISRDRPSELIPGYLRMINSPGCESFPSSHSSSAVSFYLALVFVSHPLAIGVGIWAFLVAFSRLYLGVHYLTDILGGAILGSIIAVIFYSLGLLG